MNQITNDNNKIFELKYCSDSSDLIAQNNSYQLKHKLNLLT